MKCKQCGNEVQENWMMCPFCGAAIEKKKLCAKCGAELQPNWAMCPFCGETASLPANKHSVPPASNLSSFDILPNTDSLDILPKTDEFSVLPNVEQPSSILPSVDDILPSDFDLDLVAGDIAEAQQRQQSQHNAEYQKKLNLARIACIRKNFEQANSIYEEFIAENPEDVNAYIGFVRIATQNYTEYIGEEIDEAIEIAQQIAGQDIAKLDNEIANYLKNRKAALKQFAEEKKRKEAAERIAKAEEERKLMEELEREEAERLARLKEQEMRHQLELQAEAARKHKEDVEKTYEKASELYESGKYREAAKCLRTICNEDHNKAKILLGDCYVKFTKEPSYLRSYGETNKSLYDSAVSWYKKAMDNGSIGACFNIGNLYQNILEYKSAVEWYTKYFELNNNNEDVCSRLAFIYEYKLKDIASAKKWYKKSADLGNIQSKLALKRLENR